MLEDVVLSLHANAHAGDVTCAVDQGFHLRRDITHEYGGRQNDPVSSTHFLKPFIERIVLLDTNFFTGTATMIAFQTAMDLDTANLDDFRRNVFRSKGFTKEFAQSGCVTVAPGTAVEHCYMHGSLLYDGWLQRLAAAGTYSSCVTFALERMCCSITSRHFWISRLSNASMILLCQ